MSDLVGNIKDRIFMMQLICDLAFQAARPCSHPTISAYQHFRSGG